MVGRRARYLAAGVAVLVLLSVVCVGLGWAQGRRGNSFARVQEVHQRHTDRLLAIKGVVGTALGETPDGASEIMVLTADADVVDVPEELEGVPVTVEVTGEFFALAGRGGGSQRPGKTLSPTDRWPRPVPIGVSTGNAGEASAGTIGCRVMVGNTAYALSNNHVYALENNALTGSRVLQPGRYDTPGYEVVEANVIGYLADFEPLDFSGGDNEIDAAIALSDNTLISNTTPRDGYGTPGSVPVDATLGLRVQKYGRTTRLTKGSVSGINATLVVTYGSRTARFVNQVLVSGRGFIKAGDSGSLLVTQPGRAPVGLLFAGNGSGSLAVANRIDLVLNHYQVTIK